MKAQSLRLLALCSFAALGACAEETLPGFAGPGVEINIAPLTLPNVAGVEYAIGVFNASPATATIFNQDGTIQTNSGLVWSQDSVTSNQYGNNGGGDIAYVGPCDASVVGDNYVAVALKQVDVGANGGSYTGVAPFAINAPNNMLDDQNTAFQAGAPYTNDGDPDFDNPCPYDDPCVLPVKCLENKDVEVVFNLTIMRDANQGFFDIAVNFEDIYCSAKFDTCYEGGVPIELLFGDGDGTTGVDGLGRDRTGVFAMACTAGTSSGVQTDILMSRVTVDCPNDNSFTLPIAGATGGNEVVPASGTAPPNDVEYAVYYGAEDLVCPTAGNASNSCNKTYLNIAINLEDLPDGCTLSLQATAQDGAKASFTRGFVTTMSTSGTSYPFVQVASAPLDKTEGVCTRNPLNGGDGKVTTFYSSSMESGTRADAMVVHSSVGQTPQAILTVVERAGLRIAEVQCTSGTWGWPLSEGCPAGYANITAPTAQGLADAYTVTGSPTMLSALQRAGASLLAKTDTFSLADGYLAVTLDEILSSVDHIYSAHVNSEFYAKLHAGTYNPAGGTDPTATYTTQAYLDLKRSGRTGGNANIAAWDMGMALYAAQRMNNHVSGFDMDAAWLAAAKGELEELSSPAWYDVIGLAGVIIGLAYANEDFDPTAGAHASASGIADLVGDLLSYQIPSTGAFTWQSDALTADDSVTQETAYAVLALVEARNFGMTGLDNAIDDAAQWLIATQLTNGGWYAYVGAGEYGEIVAEATSALVAAGFY